MEISEIHGDEGTVLQFPGLQTEVEVIPLRVISIGKETGKGNINCLAVDRSSKFLSVVIDNMLMTNEITSDTMIECIPSRIFGNSITLSREDSYIRIMDNDPLLSNLVKIRIKN